MARVAPAANPSWNESYFPSSAPTTGSSHSHQSRSMISKSSSQSPASGYPTPFSPLLILSGHSISFHFQSGLDYAKFYYLACPSF